MEIGRYARAVLVSAPACGHQRVQETRCLVLSTVGFVDETATGHEEEELAVSVEGMSLPATVDLPELPTVGGLIPLHGAAFPRRDSFLYTHLASVLSGKGWAILRYDRRPSERMVPLARQVEDALAALRLLRSRPALEDVPIGLWGVNQGAWTAVLTAAATDEVAFLVLVGFSGVSPSRQMRYAIANFLRQAGYGSAEDLAGLTELRQVYEAYVRGDTDRIAAQGRIDQFADRPWFDLAYVPRALPDPSEIVDSAFFDFDPRDPLSQVRCPVILFYGAEDEEVPVDESIAAVEEVVESLGHPDLTVCRLEGVGHALTRDKRLDTDALHPDYETTLITWLAEQVTPSVE